MRRIEIKAKCSCGNYTDYRLIWKCMMCLNEKCDKCAGPVEKTMRMCNVCFKVVKQNISSYT